jgi:hypothetical protein
MRFAGSLAIIMATVISSPVIAQGKIDPATIAVPDVSLPKDRAAADDLIANGWKYHFFHKDRVSFETARADVAIRPFRASPGKPSLRETSHLGWSAPQLLT